MKECHTHAISCSETRKEDEKEEEVLDCWEKAASCHEEGVIIPHPGPIPGFQIPSRGWTLTVKGAYRYDYICGLSEAPILHRNVKEHRLILLSPRQGSNGSRVSLGQNESHLGEVPDLNSPTGTFLLNGFLESYISHRLSHFYEASSVSQGARITDGSTLPPRQDAHRLERVTKYLCTPAVCPCLRPQGILPAPTSRPGCLWSRMLLL